MTVFIITRHELGLNLLQPRLRGSEVQSVTSPTPTPTSPTAGKSYPNYEALGRGSQRYNCSIIRRGNAAEHTCPGG